MGVSCSQGTIGDVGPPGPQGPMGIGITGPPVGHKCMFLQVHMGINVMYFYAPRVPLYCQTLFFSVFFFTHRVKMEPPALKDFQEPTAGL